jgi:hypothetical protein
VENIIKSLAPVALLVAGAVVFALGVALLLASDATLAASSSAASGDLAQAGRWLQFVAAMGLLAAVCTAGWEAVVRSEWAAGAEIAAAALGTLLLTIGLAAVAASNGSDPAGPVTVSVGIGVWALLTLSRAARASLAEQGHAHAARSAFLGREHQGQADLWLAAAIGLFILAIGYGLTSAGTTGPEVAAGVLEAAGVAMLAGSVAIARSRRMLDAHPVPVVLVGLALLAISFLAYAIVAGLDFSEPSALGAGLTVAAAVEVAAVIALGLAAWTRLRELYRLTR